MKPKKFFLSPSTRTRPEKKKKSSSPICFGAAPRRLRQRQLTFANNKSIRKKKDPPEADPFAFSESHIPTHYPTPVQIFNSRGGIGGRFSALCQRAIFWFTMARISASSLMAAASMAAALARISFLKASSFKLLALIFTLR